MSKTYADYTTEILADDLYEGLLAHGLFSEKIPPILSSESFFEYCKKETPHFSDKWRQFITFESMRNINIPRVLGIPNPMSYQQLCKCLSNSWENIKNHFANKTQDQDYVISRIHIRKLKQKDALFSMSYSNWKEDETPEPDLLIGSTYLVKADISTCFPSIYTHSVPWALVGKATAKANSGNKFKNEWYNQIDHYTQNCKNGETHGLLIGPHASNLLSEIILVNIDKQMYEKGWRYTRCIDDFTCYVRSYEDGQRFLVELGQAPREYDFSLNFKKTEILKLPVASVEQWVRKINSISLMQRNGQIDFIGVRAYLDSSIELMQANKDNSAILNYAIKVLGGQKLTPNAQEYCVKTIFHLCLIYPYLIPLLEEYVFLPFSVQKDSIEKLTQKIYELGYQAKNFEAVCYAIYFSIKYKFSIPALDTAEVVNSDSCLYKLFSLVYYRMQKNKIAEKELKDHARKLSNNEDDFGRNWLFVFEALPQSELKDDWKNIKKYGVSFIKSIQDK